MEKQKDVQVNLFADKSDAKFAVTLVAAILIIYWGKLTERLARGGDIKFAAAFIAFGATSAMLSATVLHGTRYEGVALLAAVFFAIIGAVFMGAIGIGEFTDINRR